MPPDGPVNAQSPYLIGESVETKTVWHPTAASAPPAQRP